MSQEYIIISKDSKVAYIGHIRSSGEVIIANIVGYLPSSLQGIEKIIEAAEEGAVERISILGMKLEFSTDSLLIPVTNND